MLDKCNYSYHAQVSQQGITICIICMMYKVHYIYVGTERAWCEGYKRFAGSCINKIQELNIELQRLTKSFHYTVL